MSINLYFESDDFFQEFPFQTPTQLTKELLAQSNVYKQLSILINWMDFWRWNDETIIDISRKFIHIMSDKNIRLVEM